ncbi:DarT1-associated NADAR antitoxin family protein [Phaeobacter inhibens]|uniref:DarT1-associated NADAR antitoxin family protein n=1 Tax=Phaeobacter inhibens TaxID=221822 RepID=UPI0021A89345|nr:hypothetical protein [Phaeobacter inhibens]UWR48927.1 hypothetical protein K4F87_16805 [Phaeobacter inhibens]
MATRPVFFPSSDSSQLVHERSFEFPWASGFAEVQKKKNIHALHSAAREKGVQNILEISSKSSEELGRKLSAFSLKIDIGGRKYPLESVYQGSKVFEQGGPFKEVFELSPREAKRFIRERNLGKLVGFELDGKSYPLSPMNAFYDWLYIRSLKDHADWIDRKVHYDAFTDIEFNPAKQVNCQARAFAEYLTLLRQSKLLEAAEDFSAFAKMIQTI